MVMYTCLTFTAIRNAAGVFTL